MKGILLETYFRTKNNDKEVYTTMSKVMTMENDYPTDR